MRKWRCVEDNYGKFTEGKIYITDDVEGGLVSDEGEEGWISISVMGSVAKFEEVFEEKEDNNMKFKVGDKVRIIKATKGSYGAEGKIGVITNERSNNGLLIDSEFGANGINIDCGNGSIWRVGCESKLELICGADKTLTITTSDTITTITDGTHTTTVKRYVGDKHNERNAVGFVVDKYYDELKEIERVSKQKRLFSKNTGCNYGIVGSWTNLTDSVGRKLCIGDVVKVYDKSGNYVMTNLVCGDATTNEYFIMGVRESTKKNSKQSYNYIKEMSYMDISNSGKLWNSDIEIK